ncbi:DCMP deaminase [Acanthamoeba castellanii str. Neff]|uniref:dCMP deaminase n=1 Tax=Acanthamoeba castellanii (strain ATCC 30010 / Neff) TaxID=1257118 RepID=L8GE30_ACACF|nr:DCMP deaminase [Acanthamoeba castellanii str. Neff]ELR11355.1 DCMP deaminase [Acanthamoeba castellanii str. Neff]
MKRTSRVEWDDYFMFVALLSAQRSKDPHTQVGACIVNQDKRIVSTGYNGFPRGCDDDIFPWKRESACEDILDSKSLYVVHAELNAVLNKNAKSVKGCTIYAPLFPCCECAKAIIQSGISRVVYLTDGGKAPLPRYVASRRMLSAAKVKCVRHKPTKQTLTLTMDGGGHDWQVSAPDEQTILSTFNCSLCWQ